MNTPGQDYLKLADSRSLEILLWIYDSLNEDGTLHTTLDSVAAECGVTKVTVNRVFQKLYKAGYLTRIRNGQYQFHNK